MTHVERIELLTPLRFFVSVVGGLVFVVVWLVQGATTFLWIALVFALAGLAYLFLAFPRALIIGSNSLTLVYVGREPREISAREIDEIVLKPMSLRIDVVLMSERRVGALVPLMRWRHVVRALRRRDAWVVRTGM